MMPRCLQRLDSLRFAEWHLWLRDAEASERFARIARERHLGASDRYDTYGAGWLPYDRPVASQGALPGVRVTMMA